MKTVTIDDQIPASSAIGYAASYLCHRVKSLEAALEEIERVAMVSEGVQFYAMVARKGLDGEFNYDGNPKS